MTSRNGAQFLGLRVSQFNIVMSKRGQLRRDESPVQSTRLDETHFPEISYLPETQEVHNDRHLMKLALNSHLCSFNWSK